MSLKFNPLNFTGLDFSGSGGSAISTTDDLPEGVINLYFTDERAQDAVGSILTDSSNIDFTYTDGSNQITADLTNTGVSASTYGSTSQVPVLTIDAKGRVTGASNTSISIPSSQITDFNEASQDAVGGILSDSSTIDLTYNDGTPSISADIIANSIDDSHISNSAAINATKIADGSVDNTEFQYLDGVTSSIQTQFDDINAKFGYYDKETIFVDANDGDDTTGNGSILQPYASIAKAVSVCTDGLKKYLIKLSPGDYTGSTVNWKFNIDLEGSGTSSNIQHSISYVAQTGDNMSCQFSRVSATLEFDFTNGSIGLPTLFDGTFNVERIDNNSGPFAVRINSSTIGALSLTGSNLLNNCLFVATAEVPTGSTLLCNSTTIGIQVELYGTGIIALVGCTVPGILNGNTVGPDTPVVRTDASSITSATLNNVTVVLSDYANYVFYDNTDSGLAAENVKDAIDELNDEKINLTEKGANNGVATLDSGGKIPAAQLPNTVMDYKGAWNASTNTPTLADGAGDTGDVYRVSVAGTQNLGSGSQSFDVGDFVIYNGTIWQWSGGSDAVMSVNGQQGIVVLDSDDIAEGITNVYFTDERAQDAIGSIITDTTTIDLSYNDIANQITADIVANSISNSHISNSAAIDATKIADGSVSNTEFQYLNGVTSAIQTQINNINSGIGALTTDDVTEATNLYFTDERAQDAVGNILTDSLSIDFNYNDVSNTITADVLPAGVDHNSLANYSANRHIDHSTVSITAGIGLTGGGDITTSRTIDLEDTTVSPGSYGSATSVATFTVDAQGRLTAASNTTISLSASNITDFNEASQDAVGTILTDSSTIDFIYDDSTPSISAIVIDNSITDAKLRQSNGLSIVGRSTNSSGNVADITANTDNHVLRRSGTSLGFGLLVDANIDASADIQRSKIQEGNANYVVINDSNGDLSEEAQLNVSRGGTGIDSSSATNGQLLIGNGTGFSLNTIQSNSGLTITNGSGTITIDTIAEPAAGDINQTQFNLLDNQATPQNITGFSFSTRKAFSAIVVIQRDTTYAKYSLEGVDKNGSWEMSQEFTGDVTGITLSITSGGQIQYTSSNTGNGGTIDFRAQALD